MAALAPERKAISSGEKPKLETHLGMVCVTSACPGVWIGSVPRSPSITVSERTRRTTHVEFRAFGVAVFFVQSEYGFGGSRRKGGTHESPQQCDRSWHWILDDFRQPSACSTRRSGGGREEGCQRCCQTRDHETGRSANAGNTSSRAFGSEHAGGRTEGHTRNDGHAGCGAGCRYGRGTGG
jgi:hypothetical protein